jgi:hypothetical protein
MWILPNVELPDELVTAQRERKLVVFVGAGASVDPPSTLPNFAALARRIAAEASLADDTRTDYDVWLGELVQRSVPVHDRAKTIIGDPASEPNDLHRAIAGLFESSEDVRVVTTNYDAHLETVLREKFADLDVFRAPALPLGRDFSGLVYLHGSIRQRADQLIITKPDFGRAYLVEAWAAPYLEARFHHDYTVLFVGYSHEDVVMGYLSSGLRGPARRYGFIPEETASGWRERGIYPVTYPVQGTDHSVLTTAVRQWADDARMGLLDHQERIARYLASDGPIDAPADSYLAACVADPDRVGLFCSATEGLKWLPWLENQPRFQNLFNPAAELDQPDWALALWFGRLAVKHPAEALTVLQRRGGRMHRILSRGILQQLFGHDRPPSAIVSTWVTVVLEDNPDTRDDTLDYVLRERTLPDDHLLTLRLFDHLTTPSLNIRPGFGTFDASEDSFPQVWVDPALLGGEHWLREAWEKVLKPSLDTCADELAVIVTHNLLSMWQRLSLMSGESHDALSAKRSAIEPHEQDAYPDEVDVLIDAARDVLEHLLQRDDGSGHALLSQWSHLPGELFRRLVVHGWTERPDKTSDEKLRWLLQHFRIVEGGGGRHEAFRLIRQHLATASNDVKREVLSTALLPPEVDYDTDDEHLAYLTYNLLYWLTLSDPKFEAAKTEFDRVQAEHLVFGPREVPDFDSWSTGGVSWGPSSPRTVDDLLKEKDLPALVTFLEAYEGDPADRFLGPDREGLMSAVRQATTTEPNWSLRLLAELEARQAEESDLWEAVLGGWRMTEASEADWPCLLEVIDRREHPERWLRTLAATLEHGVGRDGRILPDSLPLAMELAGRLWQAGLIEQTDANSWTIDGDRIDWLLKAINHWAGDLAGFFVLASSQLWRADRDNWTGLPEEIRRPLELMLGQEGVPGDAARIVLAGFALFFIDADREWAFDNVLPLFDWDDPDRAQKAWDSYLQRGGWHDHALLYLLPKFRATFPHLSTALAHRQDRFCSFMAHIAIQSSIHPLEDGWVTEFLGAVDNETIVAWDQAVDVALRPSKEDASSVDQWDRWLLDYWRLRDQGVPKALTSDEAAAMMPWLLTAGDDFPVAATIALGWPAGLCDHDMFLYRLVKHPVVDEHPAVLAKLLSKLLHATQPPFWGCHHLEIVVRRLYGHADDADLRAVCSEALRLGCQSATTWLDGTPPAAENIGE